MQLNEARPLPTLIFASRWLQLPLYLGLIVVNASGLKVKLAAAIIGISSIHLLPSAMAVAAADRIIPQAPHA
jgi:uncharacterized membrane protein YqhA